MLQITYFYDSVAIDVDNIVKPIQDAIIGLAGSISKLQK